MTDLAADGVPVVVTCRVLGIARQPYYRWLAEPVGDAEWDEAHLASAVFDAHRDDPEFGYRFLTDEVRDAGFDVCERTVWRICSEMGWWSRFGKKRPRAGRKVHTPAHDDLVRRDFRATAPNRLWLTDITEHRTAWIPAIVATGGLRWGQVEQRSARLECPSREPCVAGC